MYGEAGVVEISAGDQVRVRRMLAYGLADGASGGSIEINAGTSVQILGDVELQGGNDLDDEDSGYRFGGNGGRLSVRANYGDLLVAADIDASGGRPGGEGGEIELSARGEVSAQNVKFNVRTYDAPDSVGYVAMEAGLSLSFSGSIDASGGNIGGELDLLAGGAMALSGSINARARGVFGVGDIVSIAAARETSWRPDNQRCHRCERCEPVRHPGVLWRGWHYRSGGLRDDHHGPAQGRWGDWRPDQHCVSGAVDVLAYGNADDGSGGSVDIIAGTGVELLGDVELQGANASSGAGKFGGVGGRLDVDARYGDVLVAGNIDALGGQSNGFGGLVAIKAAGGLSVQDGLVRQSTGVLVEPCPTAV
jgi:hypothetical protein